MKKIVIGLGAVIAVVVVAVVFVFSNLGDFIKQAVETVGSEATQSKVTLNQVDLDIASGAGALKGLSVGNPAGFNTPSAFDLGAISLSIDTATVDQNPIVIREIRINAPQVTYELGDGGSNVDAIKANVDSYAKQFGGSGGGGGEAAGGESKKLVIENLIVSGGKVKVSAGFLKGKTLDAALPDLHLKDIGKDEGGANPADVVKNLIDELTKGVGSSVAGLNLDGLRKDAEAAARKAVEGVAKEAEGALKSVTEGAGDVGGEAGKAVEEGVGEAGKKLKGLFGN